MIFNPRTPSRGQDQQYINIDINNKHSEKKTSKQLDWNKFLAILECLYALFLDSNPGNMDWNLNLGDITKKTFFYLSFPFFLIIRKLMSDLYLL